jgi:hypothetical protein
VRLGSSALQRSWRGGVLHPMNDPLLTGTVDYSNHGYSRAPRSATEAQRRALSSRGSGSLP